jgi:transcriptional regulator with XRE-family HTH domain
LREKRWPGHRRITQGDLANALGTSVALVSSWESTKNPTFPPRARLEAYAEFFATERSIAKKPYRIITQLTDSERADAAELFDELQALSDAAQRPATSEPTPAGPTIGGMWSFLPGQDVTIVCSEMPQELLDRMPYTDPEAPDYVELYRYADLDALLELFAHVRMANPGNDIRFRIPAEIKADDLTSHLVLLGGVDWNTITKELLRRLEVPVRQQIRVTDDEPGAFEVDDVDGTRSIAPVLGSIEGRVVLDEDVGHFYRAPNPYNSKRTVTICNGMYQRGTYGAVRALTDAKFRDRNDKYVRTRFAGMTMFSIVSRVLVVNHEVITPDWTDPDSRLHEWPLHDQEDHAAR